MVAFQPREMKMNRNLKKQQLNNSVSANDNSFDFESWARAVRPQLLAALEKRTIES
jgi:hypothetical protein